ncbi:hypothetical protein [Brevibacillus centrosporus]|uniref:Uncharacterized protein n=1 Tax=Brevibacillus centrosporus TaxID=54910 RepID=A0A1I4CV13_9BACL|nr:hypothetical protein [Brevibacillus centrosporus]MEC2132107.1 hypothetical protein [Brevibacillus centrosporus]MED4911945.1 hypothetical protein [Brevibacillus centrosporus]RNB68696.1 hypothetical protein EDM55_16605 [Brevibacillus centrosporus]SFK84460.1 hypothetical protein SAMN05518846_12183 [Brevibacillus centrosporus]GED31699.1 hypothetical protein BCE02nite_28400 [Brevibacillus centrosporus]
MKVLLAVSLALGLTFGIIGVVHMNASATESQFTGSALPGGGIEVPHNQRFHLSTDQQWVSSQGHLSDLIRLQWTADRAKPAISWVDEAGKDKTAIVSHAKANDPNQEDHNHLSIETTMSPTGKNANQLFTRFEIPFDQDVAEIRTHSSNLNVVDGLLRMAGSDGVNRDVQFAKTSDGNVTSPRWTLRADSTNETGANAGSNFHIIRYSDAGEEIDTPFSINRKNGNVGIGSADPTTKLDVDGDRIRIRQSAAPASSSAPGNVGEIAWDSNYVYVCVAPNKWKRTELSSW